MSEKETPAERAYRQRLEANARYIAKQANINMYVPPEIKERIKAAAAAQGMSMTKFIVWKCLGER